MTKIIDEYFYIAGYDSELQKEHSQDIPYEYDLLLGPNDFKCLITEPEDRNFGRDLYPLVEELNRLYAENKKLKEAK